MIAETDLMWNGKLIKAGDPIPATEKKLITTLNAMEAAATESAEPAAVEVFEDEPAAKGKAK